MQSVGVQPNLHTLEILLPAGISFYTFQTMSYTLDIYRGELKSRKNFLDYLVFISFFPQLVAGPVERASRLLPQFEVRRQFELQWLRSGFALVIWGAFKKMVIADTIAPYVDKVFLLEDPSFPMVWAAAAGFSIQIYADFSGYTDVARGTARMLGIDLVRNFNEPHLATTTQEFWQRWHMSLSTWIRDYVAAPLMGDGERVTRARLIVSITITFIIMGAWHGAGWNFILFGLFQAAAIFFYMIVPPWIPKRVRAVPRARSLAAAFHIFAVGVTGALIFRETSVRRLFGYLTENPFAATPDEWRVTIGMLGITVVLSLPFVIEHYARRLVIPRLEPTVWYLPVQSTLWSVFAVFMFVFYRVTALDFIYFQF